MSAGQGKSDENVVAKEWVNRGRARQPIQHQLASRSTVRLIICVAQPNTAKEGTLRGGNRVAVSGLFVREGKVGGAEQMFNALVLGLTRHLPPKDVIVTMDREQISTVEEGARFEAKIKSPLGNRFLAEYLARNMYRQCDALIFPNYFTPPLVAHALPRLTVIHDLQYRHYPQFFTDRKRAWLRMCHAGTLRRSDVVVAISDSVRGDLERWHGSRNMSKVHVIGNPIDWSRFGNNIRRMPSNGSFLVVSAAYPHKNLTTLIRGFAEYVHSGGLRPLVVVGAPESTVIGIRQRSGTIRDLLSTLEVGHRVELAGYVTDAALSTFYSQADALLHPSLFEGFGVPVAEAIGLGLPAIVSDLPVLREISRGGATFCSDPKDPMAWCRAMKDFDHEPAAYVVSPVVTAQIREAHEPFHVAERYLAALGLSSSL